MRPQISLRTAARTLKVRHSDKQAETVTGAGDGMGNVVAFKPEGHSGKEQLAISYNGRIDR